MNTVEQYNPAQDLLPTRQSLLSRLKSWDDQASWQEFFATYWKLIYSAARKAGLTDAEAQDVVQETVLAICKQMPEFQYDPQIGSFKGWLLKQTFWRIQDQFRKRLPANKAESTEISQTDLATKLPDPAGCALEKHWDSEWNNNLLQAAVERAKQKADPKQFQLFALYVLQKWSVPRICAFLKVPRGQVYLAKFRVTRLVKHEMEFLKQKWI